MTRTPLLAAAALSLLAAGCVKQIEAPREPGVCFAAAEQPDGTVRFNKVAGNVKSLEYCAVELERMRLNFLRMGGSVTEVTGAYQGRFLFLTRPGIYSSSSYDGPRYIALVRYNGKLVMPGAVPQ